MMILITIRLDLETIWKKVVERSSFASNTDIDAQLLYINEDNSKYLNKTITVQEFIDFWFFFFLLLFFNLTFCYYYYCFKDYYYCLLLLLLL
jgi:hypothetical protein